jgi:hypothetical protein
MIRRALLPFGLVLVLQAAAPLAYAGSSDSEPTCWDGLEEVNALRASKGLPPFLYDPDLACAAGGCALVRAQWLCQGHTSNDFAALPDGAFAQAAGCAAWPQELGWGSCCTFEHWRYAGAAWVMGRDGRRYMHLFVRN